MFPHPGNREWQLDKAWLLCCVLLATGPAAAQEEAAPAAVPEATAPEGFLERDTLTDGWFGLAPKLKDHGVLLSATEISEVLGNVSGGLKTGAIYEGRLELDLDLDLGQLAGLDNTVFHASAYQIHGRGLSQNNLDNNLLTVSSIEATRTIRLFDLWVERGLFDNALSVRLGQIAADDEFITSQYTGNFLLASFGWPVITAQALPGGGPVYPLATPGIRIKGALNNTVILQAGLFNGNPAGTSGDVDPQVADISGARFAIGTTPFLIAEVAYTPAAGEDASAQGTAYKFGAWYQGGGFDDLSLAPTGRSLADPANTAAPRRHDGDFGFYGIADMLLYREPGTDDHGLGAFLRIGGTPGDRNFVNFYTDGGFAYKGPFASRGDDIVSFGISFASISGQAEQLVHDLQRFSRSDAHAPDHEAAIELDYQMTLAPWWTVQPDMEVVFHPTPPILRPDANTPVPRIGNALIFGMRTSIRF
jgi:porin